MPAFKLTPEGIKQTKTKMLRVVIPIALAAIGAGVVLGVVNTKSDNDPLSILAFLVPAIGLTMFLIFRRAVRAIGSQLESFYLELDDTTIKRCQENIPDVTLSKEEITEIMETSKGDFIIKSPDKSRFIFISRYIEDRDQVKNFLEKLHPIVQKDFQNRLGLAILIIVAGVALATVFGLSENRAVVLVTGFILIVKINLGIILILMSSQVERRLKWRVLIFVLVLIWIVKKMIEYWSM